MAITEESRFELHQRLREVLGDEPGTTLMEHLPPTEVATKSDVVAAEERVTNRIERVAEDLTHTRLWLTERIESLDTRLTERIESLDTRLTERADSLDTRLTERIESLDARLTVRIESLDAQVSERIQSLETQVTQRMDTMATKADVKELRGDVYRVLVIQTISLVTVNAGILSGAVAFFGGR